MTYEQHSQLFLVRVWREVGSDGESEWHGRLQHVVSGAAHNFVGCPQLLDVLLAMLPAEDSEETEDVSHPKLERR